ncbi:MAG: ArsR/SmtB family transcription factor [Caldisericia bacterium]
MIKYNIIFKVLSEEKRLKLILLLLKSKGEYYVCELADVLEETHYNVSKYLNELKKDNLVKEKRIGRGVLYSINKNVDDFIKSLFNTLLLIPDEYIKRNIELLKLRLSLRENNKCVIGVNNPKWKEILLKIESDERLNYKKIGG